MKIGDRENEGEREREREERERRRSIQRFGEVSIRREKAQSTQAHEVIRTGICT